MTETEQRQRALVGEPAGSLVLAPSLLYLFRVFESDPEAHEPAPR